MKTQSQLLKDFYNAYHAWLENGADIGDLNFYRGVGLCGNLLNYSCNKLDFNIKKDLTSFKMAKFELIDQFDNADLDTKYPFNDGNCGPYDREASEDSSYLNPKRIQWVKDHL